MAQSEAEKVFEDNPERLFGVGPGFSLAAIDPASTPAFGGRKSDGKAALSARSSRLAQLQERLFAEGHAGRRRSLLLVLEGMDTSGKGGIIRHVVSAVDVQGVQLASFGPPSEDEERHDFLWRVERQLPGPGMIGCFDRSHYEDVLIHRVHGWVEPQELERRYSAIQDFESKLHEDGTHVLKIMLHISKNEQLRRLSARLDDPTKHWKYDPGDVDERLRWDDYMAAYEAALVRTSTAYAPWYVVPADNKWYSRLVVQDLMLGALQRMDPQWPTASFDVEAEKQRLAES
ncbi:polyphosphate kinase 2 family protein [Sinomonas terrae]|uniref:Polyphosphate kinase 2 family protein n=1 Tax=Sinomonas terrae TaxID=2908838 RepID=A0ABS9TZH1_9MICC|nr:polyphosphate kinase 2 family protein [Sinomonas terrae]MCH6469465.1 polyphosphate kinase 2 family protein [Sinomonas terrae]